MLLHVQITSAQTNQESTLTLDQAEAIAIANQPALLAARARA